MNIKRLALAALAAFITIFIGGFLIHHILLKDLYMQTAAVWRPAADMNHRFWIIVIEQIMIAVLAAYIYAKGFEPAKARVGQGIRFGILLGLLLAGSMSLGSYFSLSIPSKLALAWLVSGLIEYILVGIVISLIYS